jgi:hypothetical protein
MNAPCHMAKNIKKNKELLFDKPFQVGNHSLEEQHNQDKHGYPF